MTAEPTHSDAHDAPEIYVIRVKGYLSEGWRDWFEDISITTTDDAETLLTCPVVDQSALHGLLKKVRDLGLQLISVNRIDLSHEENPKMNATMKAAIYTEYGSPDVLHITEMATPTPQDNEILVHIQARSVNYGDLFARNFPAKKSSEFNMPGILLIAVRMSFGARKPKVQIQGSEFAGDVVAVGKDVTKFKVGDKVFGYRGQAMGANAEYLSVSENSVVTHMPKNMTYAEAAVVPYGGITAVNLLRKVNIQPGQKVLINGASGGIGAAALQLAKHYGAEVTGVAGTRRQDYMKALGADHVIDYTREDFTQNGETYDVIIDILGKSSFAKARRSLKKQGRYLRASFKMREVWQALRTRFFGNKKVVVGLAAENVGDLVEIRELVEARTYKSVIDRYFPLEQVAEAHRYIESGNKQGSIVIMTEGAA